MQTIFYNNQSNLAQYSQESQQLNGVQQQSHDLPYGFATFHPVKDPVNMRKLHIATLNTRLAEVREKRMELIGEISPKSDRPQLILNHEPRLNSSEQLETWDFLLSDRLLYCAKENNCPKHTFDRNSRQALSEIIAKVGGSGSSYQSSVVICCSCSINSITTRGRRDEFFNFGACNTATEESHLATESTTFLIWHCGTNDLEALNGVSCEDSLISCTRAGFLATIAVRRHAYVRQLFGPIAGSPLDAATSLPTVHLVMAFGGRNKALSRFIDNLLAILPRNEHAIKLVIAIYMYVFVQKEYKEKSLSRFKLAQ